MSKTPMLFLSFGHHVFIVLAHACGRVLSIMGKEMARFVLKHLGVWSSWFSKIKTSKW